MLVGPPRQEGVLKPQLVVIAKSLALAGGVIAAAVLGLGCGAGAAKPPVAPRGASETCERLAVQVLRFGETIADADAVAKGRISSYAGLLELLVTFEQASEELATELARTSSDDGALGADVKRARAALVRARNFARTEREAVERHARDVAPHVRETQTSWSALHRRCDGKRAPAGCSVVRRLMDRHDAAMTNAEHVEIVDELAAAHVSSELARDRDRAVAALRSVQKAIAARAKEAEAMPEKWTALQKDIDGAMRGLGKHCTGATVTTGASFVAAARPDPRKLTVLVRVRPPSKIEQALSGLARASPDEEERAFYRARAEGAFGSGFVVVRPGSSGGREALIVTNRHVVDLGDGAVLELADGKRLGRAEVVYSDPLRDVAILRPTGKIGIDEGFAFAPSPAKDQQVVIATGFPGLVGRPSYQTTRGYVSNERFRLDEGAARALSYVQHTAPIDPGSSGGPLTDERGNVLGVNTLKVTNRDAVGLAVPSASILEAIRRADTIEEQHASAPYLRTAARLSCLAFVAELANREPRMNVLEGMISNDLTGTVGVAAARALEGDETFERVWQADSVRAMRIATLVRVRAALLEGGGASVLETCGDANAEDLSSIDRSSRVRFRIRLANFESRELAFRWEQGQFKLASFERGGKRAAPRPRDHRTPPRRTKPSRPKR